MSSELIPLGGVGRLQGPIGGVRSFRDPSLQNSFTATCIARDIDIGLEGCRGAYKMSVPELMES